MKKIFKISVLFAVLIGTAFLTGCSTASNSGSSGGSGSSSSKNVAAVYESYSDRVTVYDDNSWESIYLRDGECYNSGTWERKSGDFVNGEAIIHVTYSKSNYVSTGEYGVHIVNGEFEFFFTTYRKK